MQYHRPPYCIDTDKDRLDAPLIQHYLAQESYWAQNRPLADVFTTIETSVCFGLYRHDRQAGFARVVTDGVTLAYLADVFVLPAHRGQGLGKWLIQTVLEHPPLAPVKSWMLKTADAHGLYRPFGFATPAEPDKIMTR